MKKLPGKVLAYVSIGIAVLFSTLASTNEPKCYLLLSYGTGNVHELGTTKAEDKLLSTGYIVGSYKTNSKSNPYGFGIGCHMYKNIMLEVSHREGLKAQVDSQMSLVGKILGDNVKTDLFPVKRYAELSGYSVDVLGQVNIFGPVYATGKLGAMYGKAFIAATSSKIPYDIEATRRVEGVVPIAGLGLLYKEKNSRFSFGAETEVYGKYVTIFSVFIRTYF